MRRAPLWLYSVRLLFHSTLGALHAVLIACACYGVCAPLYMLGVHLVLQTMRKLLVVSPTRQTRIRRGNRKRPKSA